MPGIQVAPSKRRKNGQNWRPHTRYTQRGAQRRREAHRGVADTQGTEKKRRSSGKRKQRDRDGGATEKKRLRGAERDILPDKTGCITQGAKKRTGKTGEKVAPLKNGVKCQFFQVAPSSGQNWQFYRQNHHHHMVAPLSGARYSSGAIFRTKLVIIITTWWRH